MTAGRVFSIGVALGLLLLNTPVFAGTKGTRQKEALENVQRPAPASGNVLRFSKPRLVRPNAEVQVQVGQVQSVSYSGDYNAQTSSKPQGDLQGVAKSAARSLIYLKAPEAGTARDLAIGGNTAAASGATWKYIVNVDSLKEFRITEGPAAGRKGLGIDITLQVVDEMGKVVHTGKYYDPPLEQRMTDEQLEKKIRSTKMGQEVLVKIFDGIAQEGSIIDSLIDTAIEKERADLLALEYNFTASADPYPDYQRQEAAVRKGVNELMDKAPMPGEDIAFTTPYRLRSPKIKELEHEQELGEKDFHRGDYQAALDRWSKLPADNEDVQFNLGVARMGLASQLVGSNPEQAYAQAAQAQPALERAIADSKKDAPIAQAPSALMREIEATLGHKPQVAAAATAAAQPATAQVPSDSVPPPGKVSSKHALLIGVSQFANPGISALPGASKDVALLADTLGKAGFPKANITTLLNEQATLSNVRNAIDALAKRVDENSLVVITISTHGTDPNTLDITGREGFIVCYDTIPDPNFMLGSAYPVLDFREHVDRRIPCKQKIIIQDTCHSGAGNTRYSGTTLQFTTFPAYMAVLNAADEKQPSWELTSGNGIFTKTLSDFWTQKKGKFTVAELRDHLVAKVPENASKIGKTQTPRIYLGPGAELVTLN